MEARSEAKWHAGQKRHFSSEGLNAVLVERVVWPLWSRAILVKCDRALSQGPHKWLNLAQRLEEARSRRGPVPGYGRRMPGLAGAQGRGGRQ